MAIKCKHCSSDLTVSPGGVAPKQAPLSPSCGPASSETLVSPAGAPMEKCPTCNMDVPANAQSCPYCKEDLKPGCLKSSCLLILFGLGAILFIGLGIAVVFSGLME